MLLLDEGSENKPGAAGVFVLQGIGHIQLKLSHLLPLFYIVPDREN